MSDDNGQILYEVNAERTERACLYVYADSQEDVEAKLAAGLLDALDQSAWYCGDDPEVEYDQVTTSRGNAIWSGGHDGDWVDPA